eukprot:TRINITY_DN4579_c0_g1_i2.p1 TRINITY_DN4579_c0_g1~~TRINITY_DN4579_c0_g1_i2.p1  ORF type:complete len:186 (-),score=53.63 TRINITY_DN4579_c0_g1_i2:328-885(-)
MPLNPKVSICFGISTIHGNCWIANEDINEGEIIWTPPLNDNDASQEIYMHHINEIKLWSKEKQDYFFRLGYEVKKDYFIGFLENEQPPKHIIEELFVNHSCDGNAWYLNNNLVARFLIRKGEEITYDYAQTETSEFLNIDNCKCGTIKCRKFIRGSDWQLRELQQTYNIHFMDHVLQLINNQKSN